MADLASAIRAVKAKIKKTESVDDDLDFLENPTKKNTEDELTFEILKDIYVTKKSEAEAATSAREQKEHNQKILAIIQSKKEAELQGKSIEELEAMLK